MKISGPGQVGNVAKAKGPGKTGGDGGFSKMLDSVEEEKEVHGTTGISRLSSVNFLPMIDGDEQSRRRKQAVEETDDLLDELSKIRDALLVGNLSAERLQAIRAKIDKIETDCGDGKLNEIIEEVKTRAAVELAKLGF